MSRSQPSNYLTSLLTSETASVYIRQREETTTMSLDVPKFQIVKGRRPGTKYAVFNDSFELFEFTLLMPWVFADCSVVNFGEYDNAFDITHWGPN